MYAGEAASAVSQDVAADAEVQRLAAAQVAADMAFGVAEAAFNKARVARRDRIMAYIVDLTERDSSIYTDTDAYRQRVNALTADFATFSDGFYVTKDAWQKARERARQARLDLDARIRALQRIPDPLEP